MLEDLRHAQASVDWAVANFPSLQNRLNAWVQSNLKVIIEDGDSQQNYDLLIVRQEAELPLAFNVEVGAYINAIRSSLDILATALCRRFGVRRAENAYFPVARSEVAFRNRDYKGHEFIEGLPAREKAIFVEYIQPYPGGNDLLVLLHKIDIERKHRNLLGVVCLPSRFRFVDPLPRGAFTPNSPGFLRRDNKTELGKLAKGAPRSKVELHALVAFDEVFFPKGSRLITALTDFATMATSFIRMFDASESCQPITLPHLATQASARPITAPPESSTKPAMR